MKMERRGKMVLALGAILIAVIGGFAVSGLLNVSRTISSTGTVKAINVEVFWDLGCTQPVSEMDWGLIEPGENVTNTIYLKNTGNAALVLNMSYANWNPASAGNYIVLSWNREGLYIDVDEVLAADIIMSVSDTITGITGYSFEMTILGEG